MKKLSDIIVECFANDGLPLLTRDLGPNSANPVDSIVLANENRFDGSFLSEPLTNYATGWSGSDEARKLKEFLDFLAPEVPVGRRFEFRTAENAEALLSETDDIRAIGSGFKRVEYKGGTTNSKTYNKGLTGILDKDEMQPGDEEMMVSRLQARLLRSEARRAATALLAIDNTGTNKTWGSSADPDGDVLSALDSGGDSSGLSPNRVLYGNAAWILRRSAAAAQATAGAFGSASIRSAAELAEYLGVESVMRTDLRYQSTASAKAKIVGSYVVVFNAQANIGKDDPSNMKRFVTRMGSPFRVFRQEFAKTIEISVEHYSHIVATATVGAKKLNIS